MPSSEALSTTTIACSACVWARSAASDSTSSSRRFQVTTTATTRVGSAVVSGTSAPYRRA